MLAEQFTTILWVTGAITATPILQFLAPHFVLAKLYRIDLADEAGVFFARHWGIMAACFGGLLLYAAGHPAVRHVVVVAALIEKAGILVAWLVVRGRPFARGLRLAVAFDTACVAVYAAWLATAA
jgi:hypothetical protein